MFNFRRFIVILCLALLAWSLTVPIGAPDILCVLPVIATLLVTFVSIRLPKTSESEFLALVPSLSSISLRAPPQQ